jgi:DNA uptake protein ComE-like DNA-binding protein
MFHSFQRVKYAGLLTGAVCAGILLLTGCMPAARSPDTIRQDSAAATAAVVRNTKAAAQGVFAGLRAKGPLNINKASESELEALPGIDAAAARRIIAGRPYETSMELTRRHVISRAEYNKIASKVVAR